MKIEVNEMKVLLMSPYPPPNGGIASWTKRILELGLNDGWVIEHIDTNMIGGRDSFQKTKISLITEIKRAIIIWKKEFKLLLSNKDIKIVHTCIPCSLNGMYREIFCGLIAKICRRKFVLHCRCTVPNVVNSNYKKFIFKILAFFCDAIVTLNSNSYDFVKLNTKCKVKIIPNFASSNELADKKKNEYNDKISNAIYVGGITTEKGCDKIIEIAKLLPDINFHLVGSLSPEIQAMEKSENIIFYGSKTKDEVQELLKGKDVFLFLSRYWGEGFSNALVEAMSAGIPCVVSDWAANADMIEDKGGIIVNPTDINELYSALVSGMNDKDVRRMMGEFNLNKVKNSYLDEVIIPQYVGTYEELIKRENICGES